MARGLKQAPLQIELGDHSKLHSAYRENRGMETADRCERGNGGGWVAFARDNSELFQPGLLRPFYSQAQLESELARRVFLLPHSAPTWRDACA
jgi:hypothetical protein